LSRRIIIVGGGPVGLCIAALLSDAARDASITITLVDAREVPSWNITDPVDLRVYAISRASQQILGAAGVWAQLSSMRVSAYEGMRIWEDAGGPQAHGGLHFDAAQVGEPDLGHIVEDRLLRASLFNLLPDDVEYLSGQQVADLVSEPGGIRLLLDSGADLRASLVVGADGRNSAIRQLAGISTTGWSYGQQALVAHVATRETHRRMAYQRFLADGPVALLPLADGRSSVVWSASEARIEGLLKMTDDEFCRALTEATCSVLGDVDSVTQRNTFPLQLRHAQRYVDHRLVLVGDAAHTVHPLAGQGANMGLLDAAALADVVADGLGSGEDPGDRRLLRRYERSRKGDNVRMMLALDGLHRLFGLPAAPFAPLRRAGLAMVNGAGPIKSLLIREALGLGRNRPRVAGITWPGRSLRG